ncbi:MAG: CRISPR-associated endonuclease Cas2 [Chloroflexota bacterium]
MNFILVVYDISSDKRRTKLHNKLLDYGTPVQYSVFECNLTAEEIERLKKAVQRIVRPTKDHVRYYPICASCLKKVDVIGGVDVLGEPPAALVVG